MFACVAAGGTEPAIWRQLRLPGRTTLDRLHDVLQVAFGWDDRHLHSFSKGETRYRPPGFDLGGEDEQASRIGEVVSEIGEKLLYTYDFGDNRKHDIVVENICESDGVVHAVCLAGEHAAPPKGTFDQAAVNDTLSRIRLA